MLAKDIYIDLGTNNTIIYGKGRGLLLNEPSLLATQKVPCQKKQKTFTGNTVKSMIGKAHSNIEIFRPLKEGVIQDFNTSAKMLSAFLKIVNNQMILSRSRIVISLPHQVNEYEHQLVEEVAYDMGASIVHLIYEPVAGALGSNLDILNPKGQMIIDFGAGTTEAVIFSRGSIVTSKATRIGGNTIDSGIIELLFRNHQFYIGEQTAEFIKKSVGMVQFGFHNQKALDVGGLNLVTGLPKKLRVDTSMIYPAIKKVVDQISETTRSAFDNCPPELAGDIVDSGITLVGGGALLPGLSQYLTDKLGVKVKTADSPLMSVSIGGARLLEDNRLFDTLAAG